MLPVKIHSDALSEAEEARMWYNKQLNKLGESFLDEIDAAIEKVQLSPNAWLNYK